MSRSLQGLCILNTRPLHQACQLSQDIRQAGGIAIEFPSLEIKATPINWIPALPDLTQVDRAIFTSANSVCYCFTALDQHQITWPFSIDVIAIGQASARALQKYNIHVNTVPDVPNSEHILALSVLQHLDNQNILLFKGKGGRGLIEEHLVQRGAKLDIVNVYQRILPQINYELSTSIWHDDKVDIILLTSEQSLHNLFKLFEKEAHDWLRNKTWLIISERLAQIAFALGIRKIKVSPPEQVMNTLFDYVNKD